MPHRTTLALFITTLLASSAFAQNHTRADAARQNPFLHNPQDLEATRAEESKIREREDRIEKELATLDRSKLKDTDWAKEWAGLYRTTEGQELDVRIMLAPTAGVTALAQGPFGLHGANHGEVVEQLPDGLRLKLRFGSAKQSYISERVYFVKWDNLRFLVADWMMPDFIHRFNYGGDTRDDMFCIPRLVREGEYFGPAGHQGPRPTGVPQLPPEFAKLLLVTPAKVKVTKATPLTIRAREQLTQNDIHDGTLELEGGANLGLYEGMRFPYLPAARKHAAHFHLTRVDATTCTAAFTAVTEPGKPALSPSVGDIVVLGEAPQPPAAPKEPAAKPTAHPTNHGG